MLFRALHDPIPPAEAACDTPEMAETAAAIDRDERRLQVLAEVTEISLRIARGLGALAEARILAATNKEVALEPGEDPAAAYNKAAQTVRRCVALEARIAAGVKAGRAALAVQRSERFAKCKEDHAAAKTDAVVNGLHDAWAADCPDGQYEDHAENLLEDVREYLRDADEFRGWLDRPVGETVARLCAALDLDPDACAFDGATWIIRRPPMELERSLALYKFSLPPLHGEGGFEQSEKTGGEWRSANDSG